MIARCARLGASAGAVGRFPLTLACALLWCVMQVDGNHSSFALGDQSLLRQLTTFALLGFFVTLAATLFGESRGWDRPRCLSLGVAGLVLTGWAVWSHGGGKDWIDLPISSLLMALIALTTAAPYLRQSGANRAFWEFNRASWLSAAFGLLVAMLATAGLVALVTALNEFFLAGINRRVFRDILTVAFGLLAPWLALSGVPRQFDRPLDEAPPRWVAFLASYLLVPLVAVYLLLVYLYIGKTVLWQLTGGEVGWLVSGFAIAGVAAHLFSYPLATSGRRWVMAFQRHFYHLLWPPLILLWVALTIRVGSYGLTESRYMLALFTFWMTLLALYFTLRGKRLVLVPASLGVLLVLASTGPWGAIELSTRSQMSELTTLLERHDMLRNGKIVPATKPVPKTVRYRLRSIVGYLSSRERRPLLEPMTTGLEIDQKQISWSNAVVAAMDLDAGRLPVVRHRFIFKARQTPSLLVAGYDQLIRDGRVGFSTRILTTKDGRTLTVALEPGDRRLRLTDDRGRSVSFDLGSLAERLRADPEHFKDGSMALTRALDIEAAAPGLKVRIMFSSLVAVTRFGRLAVESGGFRLLVALD